jgi:lysophospholipase
MITTKTIAAGIIALTTLSAVPANASGVTVQFGNGPNWGYQGNGHGGGYRHHWQRHRLSVDEVRWMLRDSGYRAIRFFDTNGPVYQLRASKRGRDFFLVINARSGPAGARAAGGAFPAGRLAACQARSGILSAKGLQAATGRRCIVQVPLLAGLVEIPTNPIPKGAVVDTVSTDDGVGLRYARWAPNRSPVRGTVVILHGRTEFIEKYFETINDLRRRGFAVATFDSRGQGGSTRLLGNSRKGHVRDFADHVNDFETIMQEVVLPDCPPPYYVLAHSTGAAIALLSAERLRTQIDRMVLTAPLLALAYGTPRLLAQVTGFLMHFGLGEAFSPGAGSALMQTQPFAGNPLTSDPARYQRALAVVDAEPAVGVGGATIGWVNAAMRACMRLAEPDFAETVPMPVLIVLGGADTIVSNLAAEEFSRRVKTAAHLRIPGAKHEILIEKDQFRDQFWVAFDAFVAGRS